MEQDKMLTIMGSPGSGKTTTAVKLARTLAARRKNVILVLCDPFTPVIPALLPAGTVHDTSLGFLLTAPGLTQGNILNACVPAPGSEYISLLGYKTGEGLMNYPKVTRDKALELFVSLRYLADYIIIDGTTIFEADPSTFVAIETADRVLKMGTANLKGISWFQTHSPMLADSRYRKDRQVTAMGNLKVGQDWESVSGQYGGVDYMLPYIAELEQQDNEMALFEPMFSQESTIYQAEINRILLDVFDFQVAPARQTGKRMADVKRAVPDRPEAAPTAGKEKHGKKSRKGGFKVPFARSRGEF